MKEILKKLSLAAVLIFGVGLLVIMGLFFELSRTIPLNEYRFLTSLNHFQTDFWLKFVKNNLLIWIIYLVTFSAFVWLLVFKRKISLLVKAFLAIIPLIVLIFLFSEIIGGFSQSTKLQKMGRLLVYPGVKNIEVNSTEDGILAFDRTINFTVNKNIDELVAYYKKNVPDGFTLDNPNETPAEDSNPEYLNSQLRLLGNDTKEEVQGEYRIDFDSKKNSGLTKVSLLDLTR